MWLTDQKAFPIHITIFPDVGGCTVSEPALRTGWFGNRQGACLHIYTPQARRIVSDISAFQSCPSYSTLNIQRVCTLTQCLKYKNALMKIMATWWPLDKEMFSVAKVFKTIEHLDWFMKQHDLKQLLIFFSIKRESNRKELHCLVDNNKRQEQTVSWSGVLATNIQMHNRVKTSLASTSNSLPFPPNGSVGGGRGVQQWEQHNSLHSVLVSKYLFMNWRK